MASMLEIIDCMEPNGDSERSAEEEIAELREELGYCYETIAYLKEEGLNGTLIKRMREIERLQKEVEDLKKLVRIYEDRDPETKLDDISTYPWPIQAGAWIVKKLIKFFTRKK